MQKRGESFGSPEELMRDFRQGIQAFHGLCQLLSWPLSAWTRKFGTWGDRNASGYMAAGWMAMLLFALPFPKDDHGPLVGLWLATAVMLLLHRVKGAWLRKKGHWVPSMYTGDSRIPGDNWRAKGTWEPGLAILLGAGLCLWNAPVGAWLIVAGIAQGFAVGFAREEERAAVRAARDARALAQYEMELLRKELGEDL